MFRPISLYNVIYKTITKILMARLEPFLTKLISSSQSSFITGRSTTDNVIIIQKNLHSLRKKKGKKGGMILKIDLEKAYDKISCEFLAKMLRFLNFSPELIKLIMSCVTSISTAIL